MIAYGHWSGYPCHPDVAMSWRVGVDEPVPCHRCGGAAEFVKDGEGTVEELVALGIIDPDDLPQA